MAISVGVANPGNISGVGVAQPGQISGVGVAQPGRITSVGNATPGTISGVGVLGSLNNAAIAGNAYVNQAQVDYQKLIRDALSKIGAQQQPVYAPRLDFAAINAQSRAAAENAVNPLYTRKLNEFLAEQSAKRARQQQTFETANKILEEDLGQALGASELQRSRTAEDVATNIGQTRQQEQQFQEDSGTQFEDQRLAQARAQAASGILGSGAGQRQTTQATGARNTQEKRQVEQFNQARAAQELFKTRSFEDLLKSDELSKLKTTRGKEAAKFDLDAYIQDLGFEETKTRSQLEEERLGSIQKEVENQRSGLVSNFINSIQNAGQRDAAFRAYGGML
jgi:hypothetical protein